MKKTIECFEHSVGHKRVKEQLHIEDNDNASHCPAENFQPKPIGEFPHLGSLIGKPHQRPDGEAELHAQNHLAGHQQLRGFTFTKNSDYEHRRNNRQRSGD